MKIIVKDRPYLIPSYYKVMREESEINKNPEELARHFEDVFKLYLRRLAVFEMQSETNEAQENELSAMLTELIKTKRLLAKVS